ncbi:hypothetical protein GQ55_7G201400 [Panicum hallii var. hallii]|uniref:Uncharacterized protein n=1 Tax=Panicum hallii var. hallii TaxID=1504633 RepID=A0A2T7CWZ5_9POAL|nr:hypothetical protein GQ55_7G201400 [Panicum hallii var. hallii]
MALQEIRSMTPRLPSISRAPPPATTPLAHPQPQLARFPHSTLPHPPHCRLQCCSHHPKSPTPPQPPSPPPHPSGPAKTTR